jgi:hypothetical protein
MTTFDDIRSKTSALKEQITKLQAEAAEQIKPLLQQFIQDHPQVEEIKWTQYTPYFNDGEECVFRVHKPSFKFVGDDSDYDTWTIGSNSKYSPSSEICSSETALACKALEEDLKSLEDELKLLFGDHAEVVVTKDGVEVGEYEHE